MLNKITILFLLAAVGCTSPGEHKETTPATEKTTAVSTVTLPDGFSIVEEHPLGYFIRVASSERATKGSIQTIATSLAGKFDRIDLCTVGAHERGDEYASIIDGKLYDYVNDQITALK